MRNSLKAAITVGVLFFAVIVAYGLVRTAPTPEKVEPEEVSVSIRVLEAERARVQLQVVSQGSVVPHMQSDLIPEGKWSVQWVSPQPRRWQLLNRTSSAAP